MKITRALLLSSQKQAESWERTENGHFFGIPLFETKYRFLVTEDSGLRFQIFCMYQEKDAEGKAHNITASDSHVDTTFADMGRLINFLHRFQIDFETAWQPVETQPA